MKKLTVQEIKEQRDKLKEVNNAFAESDIYTLAYSVFNLITNAIIEIDAVLKSLLLEQFLREDKKDGKQ